MTFHCTLVRGPLALLQDPPVELAITIVDGGSGALVQAAVAAEFKTGELVVGGLPLSGLTVGAPPLVPGAVLVDGADPGEQDAPHAGPGPAALSLLVHAGPAAGVIVPLERGSYRIGRSHTDICLADPDVSRDHAVLTVSETAVTITDNASSNGTTVDGRKIRTAVLSTASRIRCGDSVMSIVFDHDELGIDSLRAAGRSVAEPLSVPRSSHASSRAQVLLTAGLPLLLGVAMALATGMWMFLGFTAISAVAVLAPAIAGRRQRHALAVAVEEAVEQDRNRRRRSSPSAAELAFTINSSSFVAARERGPNQLTVPVAGTAHVTGAGQGTGTTKGTVAAEGTTTGQETVACNEIWLRIGTSQQKARVELDPVDPSFQPPLLGQAPLTLDPGIQTVSVAGPQAKVEGMFRFLLMQLAAFPAVTDIPVLIHGPLAHLPIGARFLPGVAMSVDLDSAEAILSARANRAGALFLVGSVLDSGVAALRQKAVQSGWRVFQCTEDGDQAECVVELWDKRAVLRSGLSKSEFDPDLVPHFVFDRFCRSLAAMPVVTTQGFGDALCLFLGGLASNGLLRNRGPLERLFSAGWIIRSHWARGRPAPVFGSRVRRSASPGGRNHRIGKVRAPAHYCVGDLADP
ncbi:FHA domain-containing protein [Arthrobacter sp. NA-172]|uniref:FHA domain-containing protein n=1 Tax=Arthrobacter sp. NA-172 TaxID=3367524 RepID=UPI00375490C7